MAFLWLALLGLSLHVILTTMREAERTYRLTQKKLDAIGRGYRAN